MSVISVEYNARFDHLLDVLPERFTQAVTDVRGALPGLLSRSYPMVLTHSDL
jgi:hypothetical protein